MSIPSYNVSNIFLAESRFSRTSSVSDLNQSKKHFTIDIEPINLDENIFNIALNVTFFSTSASSEEHEVDFFIKMIGLFEKIGDHSEIPNDYFVNVNAPAIIFPFVREHVSSITAKAGIDAVLLPPFNFVDNYQKSLQNDQEGRKVD